MQGLQFNLEFRFWSCANGQCVRDIHQCDGNCPDGFELNVHTGECVPLTCKVEIYVVESLV